VCALVVSVGAACIAAAAHGFEKTECGRRKRRERLTVSCQSDREGSWKGRCTSECAL
jgi:hypothetical protein